MILTCDLNSASINLYREMLDKLLMNCDYTDETLSKKFADAVWLVEEYIKQLYELMPECFDDLQQEIDFFKFIKPLFVAEREYHQRRYHAGLFGTDNKEFWCQELARMEKLLEENISFSDYYHNGYTHNDADWFTKGQLTLPTSLCMSIWEVDRKYTSARDNWVSGLLAVEHYHDWLGSKQFISSIQLQHT